MAETVDTVASLVRFIADDQEASWLDTAVQLASINAGWREFQRRMMLRSSPIFKKMAVIDIDAFTTLLSPTQTVVNGSVVLNTDGSNKVLLPDNFILPYTVEERVQGATTDRFQEVKEVEWPVGTLATQWLCYWAWQDGGLNFVGSTRALTIRVEYSHALPVFTDKTDTIPISLAADAIAWCVLYQVALARGSSADYRDRCGAQAEAQIDQLTGIHVQRDQRQRRHRRPHLAGRF